MRQVWIIGVCAGVLLVGCASSPGGGGAATRSVSLADGRVTVPVHRSFEVTEDPRAGGAPDRIGLRRESRVRGSFESCTVRVIAIPADSLAGLSAAQAASQAASQRHEAQAGSSGLHDVRLLTAQAAEGQPIPHDVVEWSFTLERTMRARERYWGLASGNDRWLAHQSCTTVASPADLIALEAATAPVFRPD
jgi:hypothetical protein